MSDTQSMTLEINGTDFTFNVNRSDYNKFINSTTPVNKVQPMYNFLTTTVDEQQRATLVELLKANPGAEMQIGGEVLDNYLPDLAIVIKKLKP